MSEEKESRRGLLAAARRLISKHLYGSSNKTEEARDKTRSDGTAPGRAEDTALQGSLRKAIQKRPDSEEPVLTIEEVYQAASLPLSGPNTVYHLRELFDSPELAGIDPEKRLGPVEMVLKNEGTSVEALVKDAIARDHAIDQMAAVLQHDLEERRRKTGEEITQSQRQLDDFRKEIEARIEGLRENLEESVQAFEQYLALKAREEQALAEIIRPFVTEEKISRDKTESTDKSPSESEDPASKERPKRSAANDLERLGRMAGDQVQEGRIEEN